MEESAAEIARLRIARQRLVGEPFETPEAVVRWLGAMQAQEYAYAKWAIGLRSTGLTDSNVDRALADGRLLRTHILRPTWHFVTPEDIRWLLPLSAPRVHQQNAPIYRRTGLDDETHARSRQIMVAALRDGNHLTRRELGEHLRQGGVDPGDTLRLAYIVMHAELEGVVVSGGRRGKQFTYALLDERAPAGTACDRDTALGELVKRYVTSRGPVTLRDFVAWSGMTLTDARRGVEVAGADLRQETIGGTDYWLPAAQPPVASSSPATHLLPVYDEYIMGYRDRSAAFAALRAAGIDVTQQAAFDHTIAVDGQLVGTWKRTIARNAIQMEVQQFVQLSEGQPQAVAAMAERYGRFVGLPVDLQYVEGSSV